METRTSTCVIANNNFCVVAKKEFPINEFNTTPHAPIHALILARKEDIVGGTAYVSHFPCRMCAKALAAGGIVKLVYKKENEFKEAEVEKARILFEENNIEVVQNTKLEAEYDG